MSMESQAIALNHSRATGTARCVLYGIANHDGDGGAWPSIASLRKYAGGVDRRAVQRALLKLEELGEIRKVIQAGGTAETREDHRPNRYIFLLKCPTYCDGSSQHRDNRKPLFSTRFEDEIDGAVVAPPGGRSSAPRAVVAPPEPSLELINRLNNESLVLNRVNHQYAESGWCTVCAYPNEHKQTLIEEEVSA